MNIAIFGAAGSIGSAAAPELIRRGHRVRVVGRDEARLRARFPACEVPAADLVYQYGPARTARVDEEHPREPRTRKGVARKAQADIVRAAHDSGGLRTAVLVLPDFYGPGLANTYLTAVFDGAASGATAPVIGPIDRPHEFVFVPDVAPVVARLFETPGAFGGGIYNLAGAGTIVPREMYVEAYRLAGRAPKLLVAGVPLQRLLGLFNPQLREMVEMNDLWTDPLVLDDAKLVRTIGPIAKTPYADGIRAGVDAAQRNRPAVVA